MPLPVTAIFAGLLAGWLIYLQFRVVARRRAMNISLGHGGDAECERLVRAHGNAAETVPVFLILMAAAESLGAPGWVLGGLGAVFTGGRVMHGVHFMAQRKTITLRFWGMFLTILATALMALGALTHGLENLL